MDARSNVFDQVSSVTSTVERVKIRRVDLSYWRPVRESTRVAAVKRSDLQEFKENFAAWIAPYGSQRYSKESLLDLNGRASSAAKD